MGLMGNNMFQVAAIKRAAEDHGLAFMVAKHVERGHYGEANGATDVELDRVFETCEYLVAPGGFPSTLFRGYVHPDMSGKFDYSPVPVSPWTSYAGYFQSDRYFGSDREWARSTFRVKRALLDQASARHDVGARTAVFAHCRFGGDRLLPGTLPYHGVVSMGYYSKAVEEVRSRIGDDFDLVVVSDMKDEARLLEMFSPLHRSVRVARNHGMCDAFAVMSLCDHAIIGNSTFSWWAAYAGNAGIVVAPKSEWFGPSNSHLSTKDLFPEGWITL